jgi:NADH-quinone oxidoreductase subunit G
LLVSADKNPNAEGARLTGVAASPMGSRLGVIAQGIAAGRITTLVVFGEDVTRHGIGADLLAKLTSLIVCDILPGETVRRAHVVLPGAAHAEKRGTFVNGKGRVQRFWKAFDAPGDARSELEWLQDLLAVRHGAAVPATIEGVFNEMARGLPALAGMEWSKLGDLGLPLATPAVEGVQA